jgi:tetratricopeptide (TPR) repeat protein
VNTGETEEESQQVQATLKRYFKGTGHALRGLLGILQGDPTTMELEFEKALKANPQDRDVDACRAELKSEIKALVSAVERMPRKAPLRARLAKRYLLERKYEQAAEQYVNFVKLEPGNAAVWNNLGICYNNMEQDAKAIDAFERAIKCDAGLVSAYLNLGDVYNRLGNFAACSQNYETALRLSPQSQTPYIYDKLARAYYRQKKYTLALGALEKAIQLASNDPALLNYLQERKEAVMRAAGKQKTEER